MVTSERLAELLADVNVEDVAREANVSIKTIYRLRHKRNSPTLATVARILDAIKRLRRQTAKA